MWDVAMISTLAAENANIASDAAMVVGRVLESAAAATGCGEILQQPPAVEPEPGWLS